MANRIWILGAQDPEMQAIESLLRDCGERVAYAVRADGGRVTPREAYSAVGFMVDGELHTRGGDIVTVECGGDFGETLLDIDHHHPGDPGYGQPPAAFMGASSLGQVVSDLARLRILPDSWVAAEYAGGGAPHILGWRAGSTSVMPEVLIIPTDLVIAAACDHCLGAAWQGQCPGVSRDDVREYRARLASTRPIEPSSREEYLERFERTRSLIEDFRRREQALFSADLCRMSGIDPRPVAAPTSAIRYEELDPWDEQSGYLECDWDPSRVVDTRACGHLDELPDVACFIGVAYLADVTERDGRRKVVLGGCTTPEIVRAFIESWAPRQGLTGIYGDPERGFAGGYV